MVSKNANKKIIALSTEIGRGHPNYLDSVLKALKTLSFNQEVLSYNIFEVATLSGLARLGWSWVKKIYFGGGYGGVATKLYNFFRKKNSASKSNFS